MQDKENQLFKIINEESIRLEFTAEEMMTFTTGFLAIQISQVAKVCEANLMPKADISNVVKNIISTVYENLTQMCKDQKVFFDVPN